MTELVPARAVCIESPLRGDIARNVDYADACMLDALMRGEAPFLGHLLYPRVLSDLSDADRARGIAAHLTWLKRADAVIAYVDLGITQGMQLALDLAQGAGLHVEYRELGAEWEDREASAGGTPGFR